MSIPGMSAAMEGVGVGAVPDMSIPGMSAAMEGVGVELACAYPEPWSIPAMADDAGLDANIITATTPATARTTAEITMRRVPVMFFIEMSSR